MSENQYGIPPQQPMPPANFAPPSPPAPQNTLPVYSGYPAGSPYTNPAPYPQQPMMLYSNPNAGQGLGIASIILAGLTLFGFFFLVLPPIIGFILGIISAKQSKDNGGNGTLGKIGWILNLVVFILYALIIAAVIIIIIVEENNVGSGNTYTTSILLQQGLGFLF